MLAVTIAQDDVRAEMGERWGHVQRCAEMGSGRTLHTQRNN